MAKLKVFGSNCVHSNARLRKDLGDHPHHNQARFVVATTSKAKAGELFPGYFSAGDLKNFMSETGNERELEVCLAEPGVVFVQSQNHGRSPLLRLSDYEESK